MLIYLYIKYITINSIEYYKSIVLFQLFSIVKKKKVVNDLLVIKLHITFYQIPIFTIILYFPFISHKKEKNIYFITFHVILYYIHIYYIKYLYCFLFRIYKHVFKY
jgi:hypothetical protein